MEKQTFKSLLNMDYKHSKNTHVTGRILGIAEIICELYGGTNERVDKEGKVHNVKTFRGGWWQNKDNTVKWLQLRCTAEQYEKFKNYIEEWYPGLLTFYWDGNK